MREYVMTLLGASLLTGILGTLCPKGHKKHLRLLCGLCMIDMLISPLPSYLENAEQNLLELGEETGGEAEDVYDEIYYQALSNANVWQIEKMTKRLIIQEFSLSSDDLSVSVFISDEEDRILLKNATVSLSGKAILTDPREIVRVVEEYLGCPCNVVYGSC